MKSTILFAKENVEKNEPMTEPLEFCEENMTNPNPSLKFLVKVTSLTGFWSTLGFGAIGGGFAFCCPSLIS